LFAHGHSVEIWSAEKFEKMHADINADEMNALAEEVMGKLNFNIPQ
jgi:hypothetical protein